MAESPKSYPWLLLPSKGFDAFTHWRCHAEPTAAMPPRPSPRLCRCWSRSKPPSSWRSAWC